VSALGEDAAAVDQNGFVHSVDVDHSMGDHHHGFPRCPFPYCLHQLSFCNTIQTFGGFIQHPDRGIVNKGPGNR
jgi:hypothetical protein